MLNVFTYTQTPFAQNCRIVFDDKTKNCIICDPGSASDATFIYNEISKYNLNAQAILLTHGHHDHCGGAQELAKLLNVPILGPQIKDKFWLDNFHEQANMFGLAQSAAPEITRFLNDNEELDLKLSETIKVLHCPGHTPGQVCFYAEKSKLLLSGDVLFAGSVGRSDFPQGDPDELLTSIREKLLTLPEDTKVLPGHGPDTTIYREKFTNPFLIGDIY
jgi:hydroxyacylglutathione hydrolase